MSEQTIPLVGTLTRSDDGSFTLTLKGSVASVSPIPPDPPPAADPRPVKTFTATGGDDTSSFQAWVNTQPNNTIYEVRGSVGVNAQGIRLINRTNVTVRAAAEGGGFRAIGEGLYHTPFSSMIYCESFNGSSLERLKLDCSGKKAMGVNLMRSARTKLAGCEAWNIQGDSVGYPWAGIYGEQNADIEVDACHVHDTGVGVRGIWFGVGNRFDVRPHIHHCATRHTGHTGIVTESEGPHVHHNQVRDVYRDGTGFKFIARGQNVDALWDDNFVADTLSAGFMIEGSGVRPPKIYVRRWTANNCGAPGTTFGFLYVSNSQGVRNLELDGAILDNCRSIGAAQYLAEAVLRNVTVKNGSDLFHYELNCNNIRQSAAGRADIGQGVTNIWVNGVKVA